MDAFFKPKNKISSSPSVIGENEPIMIDPDILVVGESEKEEQEEEDNGSLIVLQENRIGVLVEEKRKHSQNSLKQLLSGNSNASKKAKVEKTNTMKSEVKEKPLSSAKRSRSNLATIIRKEVEVISDTSDFKSTTSGIVLKQMLNGASIGDTGTQTNSSDDLRINKTSTVQNFFQQNKLKRFHFWSSKKRMDLNGFPEVSFVHPLTANKHTREFEKTMEKSFSKRKVSTFHEQDETFDYAKKIYRKETRDSLFKKRKISLPSKLLKPFSVNNKTDINSELWTKVFKPHTLEEMSVLLHIETIQTFKYQLSVSFEKLTHKLENERELLQNNWKSLLKREQNGDYDDDFIVRDEVEHKLLEHIPLYILYGPGVGKNLLLELTLKELEKEGLLVDNALELNSSVERSKKNIFDICFEAATNKFLQKEDNSKTSFSDKRKKHLGDGVLLFDEVDNLFSSDKLFYPMLVKLLQVTKKPIVLTCNFIDCLPEQLIKITDFQQTSFFVGLPKTTIPYVNKKLGLKLSEKDKFLNINQDIRHTLNQLQLDRYVEVEESDNVNSEEQVEISLGEFSKASDFLSHIDIIETSTLNRSLIKQGLDYTILDFMEQERNNEDNGEEDCDFSSTHNKMRLDGTINFNQWRNVDHLKRPTKNFYDENTFNKRQPYEDNLGATLKDLIMKKAPKKEDILLVNPTISSSSKSKLVRNLYLKLEYMKMNMLPYNLKLSPTRNTINEFLENLESSDSGNLTSISLGTLLNKNYQIVDNKLNYEFTSSNNLFCYHYPFFQIMFETDFYRRRYTTKVMELAYEQGKIDKIQCLKHLIKEQLALHLIFDQDPRIYWAS